jgi:hypothetical protein
MSTLGFSGQPKNYYSGIIGRIMHARIGQTPVQADESPAFNSTAIQYFVVGS